MGLKLHYFLVVWKMVVGISNSFFLVFSPCLAPLPNFIQIRQKTRKVEIHFWSILVGQADRSKNDDNYGPRRNVKNSWRLKLHWISVENRSLCWFLLVGSLKNDHSYIDWSKNGCRHFKLILSCFFSMFSPLAKFHPNRTKNTWNFHFWSILVGWAGRSKNGRRHIKLILCCFYPIISPHTKFHPNRTKKKRS